ncbi:flagellar hook-length control protein FliK [Shewanella gaetbuli]
MQLYDDKGFMSAFDKASKASFNSSHSQKFHSSPDAKEAFNQALDLSEPLDENNVELIFAQLDLAESFGKNNADGNLLPLDETTADDLDGTELEIDLDADSTSFKVLTAANGDLAEVKVLHDKHDIDPELEALLAQLSQEHQHKNSLAESESDITEQNLPPELFENAIILPTETESNVQFLTSLTTSELDKLMDFSKLSKQELSALSRQELVQIINDYNLQAPVVDESILALLETGLSKEENGGSGNQVHTQPMTPASINTSHPATANPNAASINNEAILGDKSRVDGVISANVNAEKSVKYAMSVEMIDANEKSANKTVFNMSAEQARNTELAMSSMSDKVTESASVDIKSLQNQSSFTPVHKSEVPQFQLSLKQQGESQVQMQDMIQRFSPVMKQQLITMVNNGVQHAEIRLDPPELGHLTVKIQINGDQTQVQFQVAQSQTRDLIEQAMPRLKDMLQQEGLQLADSHVSQDGENQANQQEGSAEGYGESSELVENAAIESGLLQNHSDSIQTGIDYYA